MIFKNKKAQGMPLNVIVIAAIVLIVLVVLIAIFSGRIVQFGESVDKTQPCIVNGGTWKDSCDATETELKGTSDAAAHPDEKCCKEKEE